MSNCSTDTGMDYLLYGFLHGGLDYGSQQKLYYNIDTGMAFPLNELVDDDGIENFGLKNIYCNTDICGVFLLYELTNEVLGFLSFETIYYNTGICGVSLLYELTNKLLGFVSP